MTFVRESDSRNLTIAAGTAMKKSAVLMRREMVFRLNGGGGLRPLGAVDTPLFWLVVPPVVPVPPVPPVPPPGVCVTVPLGDTSGENSAPIAYSGVRLR